ncbi:aquaporin-like protein [Athelia psychrophila]|uniref:Aquaporin-like protein n=1 Tax=Athelia psychrophila TaxID=1759441 RepID=A0A166UJ14_9AGAM|nr:aquaporin-like protein [Fibularhizoctonia sp. CBS 109695]
MPNTEVTPTVFLRDIVQRPAYMNLWEKHRHRKAHWVAEMFAESLGVFLYSYAGVGSTAAFICGTLTGAPGLGSLLQIGFAYAFGILFAILVCSGTSGGHFSPSVTISFVVFKGFPPLKGLRYIFAQILGGYIAVGLVYLQYKDLIGLADEALLAAKGPLVAAATKFTPNGTAGILALYTLPGANLTRVLLNEFVTDTLLALVIWAILDPTNILMPPQVGPWVVSLAYAVAIWGFSPAALAANAARDVGGRLVALTVYGTQASGGKYAALAALTNIPAMLFGAWLYEVFLTDSSRVMSRAHLEFMQAHQKHHEAMVAGIAADGGLPRVVAGNASQSSTGKGEEHHDIQQLERV